MKNLEGEDMSLGWPGPGGQQQGDALPHPILTTVLQTHTVDNIIDIQFLHGFNQPTLLKMYEPLKTQAGKIAVRKDMCRLDMVTMDVKEKLQPSSGQEKFSSLTV